MSIREKIKDRLDELQRMMERQEHLSHPEQATEQLESVTKFWTVLSEEERELGLSARFALMAQIPWK